MNPASPTPTLIGLLMEKDRSLFGRAMMSLALNPILMPKAAADKLSEESSTKEVRAVIIGSLTAVPPLGALGYMSFFWRDSLGGLILSLFLIAFCVFFMATPKIYLLIAMKKNKN